MLSPEDWPADIFLPNGALNPEALAPETLDALRESLRFAQETRWGTLRSPHLFMGLLAAPAPGILNWGERIGADLSRLVLQFSELFQQNPEEAEPKARLHREHFSDNTIRLLREGLQRARSRGQSSITSLDLLITLLTAKNSIVAECFERIGVTAAKLTEMAMLAEKDEPAEERPSSSP